MDPLPHSSSSGNNNNNNRERNCITMVLISATVAATAMRTTAITTRKKEPFWWTPFDFYPLCFFPRTSIWCALPPHSLLLLEPLPPEPFLLLADVAMTKITNDALPLMPLDDKNIRKQITLAGSPPTRHLPSAGGRPSAGPSASPCSADKNANDKMKSVWIIRVESVTWRFM